MKSRARALTLTTEGSEAGASEPGTYVQGMNVLAAPFLYAARSEAEAFVAFHRFITHECPGYVRGAMDGVHKGLALVDKVLAIVDPKLSLYLIGKGMNAELYAFPSVLTLCACTPPLPEVLRLWDFLFAYGAHLNILCIVAQLVILRTSILSSPRYISYSASPSHTNISQSNKNPTLVPSIASRDRDISDINSHQKNPRRRLRRDSLPREIDPNIALRRRWSTFHMGKRGVHDFNAHMGWMLMYVL